jgi:glycosyltransferase involved in cell wall biosynthesis
MPCYNEVENLVASVSAAQSAAQLFAHEHEIVIVDDGSADGTGALARDLATAIPELRIVSHARNRGYGAAVRSGIDAATMPYLLLTDGDGQFDLMELETFLPHAPGFDLVVGRRARRADPLGRRLGARGWNALVTHLFRLPVRDVDCAFKLVRRDVVQALPLTADGAMVSTELLAHALARGATVQELDVAHLPRRTGEQSGGSLPVIARAFRELVVVGRRIRSARP